MNLTFDSTTYTEDDDAATIKFPTTWEICSTCRGNGAHSQHLGAISAEEFQREWSEEEREDYFAGGYDQTCRDCCGSGKQLAINRDACTSEALKAALKQYDENQQEDAYRERMHQAECGY